MTVKGKTARAIPGAIPLWIVLTAASVAAAAGQAGTAQGPAAAGTGVPAGDTCLACHLGLDDETLTPPAKEFARDIHHDRGFTCAACHGGDPTNPDTDAMDPAHGFIGVPAARRVPEICGRCHADPAFMRKYNPSLPTDQLAQYPTSRHGQLLAQGDTLVAVCSGCHTAHTILPARDPNSSVNALKVASTCGRCHSDAQRMARYGIATDQVAQYEKSVHWNALSRKGDMSAPTCNDCHGDHAASPPGVESVVNVCRQCHSVAAERFDRSPHAAAFASADLPGCATCHGNHDIETPSDEMLGLGEQGFCARCHDQGDAGGQTAVRMRSLIDQLKDRLADAHALLDRATAEGVEVSEAEFRLSAGRDSLVLARVATHEDSVPVVKSLIDGGLAIASQGVDQGRQALAEATRRRAGLAVSLVIIAVLIVGVVLKLRRTRQEEERGSEGAR